MDQHTHCLAPSGAANAAPDEYDNVPEGYTGTVFTCPMHSQVRETKPGGCPICGMALEPETVTAEEDTAELDSMTRRFWVGAGLSLPLFIYAMGDLIPGKPLEGLLPGVWAQWIQFAMATPVVLWGGWPFFVRGVQSVRTMNLNMFTLISLGLRFAAPCPASPARNSGNAPRVGTSLTGAMPFEQSPTVQPHKKQVAVLY